MRSSFPISLLATFLLPGLASASPIEWPQSLREKPLQFDRALAASVRIGGVRSMSLCSGVVLGKNGYVATAAHCVGRLLQKHWNEDHYTQPATIMEIKERAGFYSARIFPEQLPAAGEYPPQSVLDELRIDDPGLERPRLVWIGSGQVNVNEENLASLPESEFAVLPALAEDVAILRYASFPASPCIPLADRRPAPGEPVWAIGFPSREPEFSGYREAVSLGSVRGKLTDDPVLNAVAAGLSEEARAEFWSRESRLWEQPRFLLTDLDVSTGSSGGMIVDSSGRLAGIVFSIMRVDPFYNGATTMGVDTSWLRSRVAATGGEDLAREIFSCGGE